MSYNKHDNFFKKIKSPKNTIAVSMDFASLYTSIRQEEVITTETCSSLTGIKQLLILQENTFEFSGKDYRETNGTTCTIV